jgi:hypothetical protein
MDPTALPTFQNLPAHLREPFLRAVNQNLLARLLPPTTDEEIPTARQALERSQLRKLRNEISRQRAAETRNRALVHLKVSQKGDRW